MKRARTLIASVAIPALALTACQGQPAASTTSTTPPPATVTTTAAAPTTSSSSTSASKPASATATPPAATASSSVKGVQECLKSARFCFTRPATVAVADSSTASVEGITLTQGGTEILRATATSEGAGAGCIKKRGGDETEVVEARPIGITTAIPVEEQGKGAQVYAVKAVIHDPDTGYRPQVFLTQATALAKPGPVPRCDLMNAATGILLTPSKIRVVMAPALGKAPFETRAEAVAAMAAPAAEAAFQIMLSATAG